MNAFSSTYDGFARLLRRQLLRYRKDPQAIPPDWLPFVRLIDEVYREKQSDGCSPRIKATRFKRWQSTEGAQENDEQEERFQLLTRAIHEAVWDWDFLSDRLWSSPGVCSLFGYFSGEVKSDIHWWRERIHPEDQERVTSMMQEAIQKGLRFWAQEYRFRCVDGFYADVMDQGYVMVNQFGRPVRAIWSTTDITKVKSLHGKVRISERMASMGQMMAGVAHELNNPLAVILGFAQSSLRRGGGDEAVRGALASIERETHRCQLLIQRLLRFSRDTATTRGWTDLTQVVDQTLTLFEPQAAVHNVRLERNFEKELPLVLANANQMQQVIINLCSNAVDAMTSGGQLKVTLDRGVEVDPPMPGAVRLRVIDEGPGIPPESRARVFDPFFTTKEAGKGTGLGLAIVSEIVKEHGGQIELDSQTGKGTTFTIWLPTKVSSSKTTLSPERSSRRKLAA